MKRILITGANKGIGFETTRQLLQKGHYVYLGSRDSENGEKAVEKLKSEGLKNVEFVQIDVTDDNSVKNAHIELSKKTEVLDILINNAGTSGILPQTTFTEVDEFKKVYDINVFGVIRVTQAFIDLLKKSDEPCIVNVSTGMASLNLTTDPTFPYYNNKAVVYQSSKTALNMYTVTLAYELRNTAFKVNAVCPGYTKTDFTMYNGGNVEDAGKRIVKYALVDKDGPTGKFFCEEVFPETECPW